MPVKTRRAIKSIGRVLFWIICSITVFYITGHLIAWAVRVHNGNQTHVEIVGIEDF